MAIDTGCVPVGKFGGFREVKLPAVVLILNAETSFWPLLIT